VQNLGRAGIWNTAALGMYVLAGFNAVLLVSAWIQFALQQPAYFQEALPTFSRTLAGGDAWSHRWLAAIAGAGLMAGGLSLAVMRWELARRMPRDAGLMRAKAVLAVFAGCLGIVHYFHVAISLSVDNRMHMTMSYLFFFGMSFLILFDLLIRIRLDAMLAQPQARQSPAHRKTGFALLAVAVLFLLTYVLKDLPSNPLPGPTQKAFVVAELIWIVLAHVYAVFYVAPMRVHFHPAVGNHATMPSIPRWFLPVILLLALAFPAISAFADTAKVGVGGTGRIQPAGGVIALSGPQGHWVERVAVKEGQRVRKGNLLLVLGDRPLRILERDLAAEKLRNLEQQSVLKKKVAELEVEAAQLSLQQAKDELSNIARLDDRTIAPRDRHQREYGVAAADTALRQATARLEEVTQGLESERRTLRVSLDLAKQQLEAAQVLAPVDATVIEVNARSGMTLGGGPAVTLADTSSMYVVADFFEGDLSKLVPGQRVQVSNSALGAPLSGEVERIGRTVDPVNRLAKVWVKLDNPTPADRYIGMQVDVRIDGNAVRPARP
jgi:HlyD family secretion protein